MANNIKLFLLFCFTLLISSCASVLNSPTQKITIITSKPTECIIDKNVRSKKDTIHYLTLKRSKNLVNIELKSDSIEKDIVLKPRLNTQFYGNLLLPYGILWGLIDLTNARRFGYKKNIRVYMSDSTSQIFDPYKSNSLVLNSEYRRYKNQLKLTPFSFTAFHGLPCFDVAYERKINDVVGIQFSTGLFLNTEENQRFIGGFKLGMEPRIYFGEQFEGRFFTGFSWNYINMDFTKEMKFYVNDSTGYITPNFPTKIHRDVFSFTIKLGYQYFISSKFSLEAYVGIGSIWGNNIHYNSPGGNYFSYDDIVAPYLEKGQFSIPSFPCNIKFNYSF